MILLFLIIAACIAALALYEVYSRSHESESEIWEQEVSFLQDHPDFRSTNCTKK